LVFGNILKGARERTPEDWADAPPEDGTDVTTPDVSPSPFKPTAPVLRVPKPEDLSDAEFAVIRTLTESDWPWAAISTLVTFGHDPEMIAAMVERKILQPWDLTHEQSDGKAPAPVGDCVSLTPLWADRLQLEIVEYGPVDRPRWGAWQFDEDGERVRDANMPPLICPQYESRIRYPERIPDPKPGPAEEVEVMLDGYTEEPVILLGMTVPIDERVGKPRTKVSKKKRAKRRKSA
jgi:hypothetical protein